MTSRYRFASLLMLVALCIAMSGCAGTEQSDAESVPGQASYAIAAQAPSGLQVSVETTFGIGPDLLHDPGPDGEAPIIEGDYEVPQPARGKVRLTVIATATNSSDSALRVPIEHNYPELLNANGEYMYGRNGGLSATGVTGSKFTAEGVALDPGGVLQCVQYYDIDPRQTGFIIRWDFGELGTFASPLPKVD